MVGKFLFGDRAGSGVLLKLRNTKKSMDRDSNMLANRIAMLRNEEERLMKKINNTRKRADEIQTVRQRSEEKYNARIRIEQQREVELRIA